MTCRPTTIKQKALDRLKQSIQSQPQQVLFADEMIREAEAHYAELVEELVTNIIEIPRIIIQQSEEVRSGFQEFDLDVSALNFQPVSEEILRKSLADNEEDTIVGQGRIVPDRLDFILVNDLINFPEIDYDEQADQLFRLAEQALAKLQSYLNEDDVINVVQYYKREIAKFVYTQMMEHFYCEAPEYEKPIVRPFTEIEPHNFSKYTADSIHDYTETITPTQAIPSKVFTGFKKACHNLYKFDSKTEKDFAAILERDADVLKWLRPARNQFRLYWRHNSRQYVPDFVVETADGIFMVETKQERDLNADEVQEKAVAAQEYCRHATEYMAANGGKPWCYVVIPHNAVLLNMGFATLATKFVHAARA